MRSAVAPFAHPRRPRGFTLIEAALAIVIVATGIVSALALFAACSQQNQLAGRITVASMLARHIEEAMVHLPFDDPIYGNDVFGPEPGEAIQQWNDVDDFHGLDTSTLGAPIDVTRTPIPSLAQYTQRVRVTPVQENNPALEGGGTGAVRVTVSVDWRVTPASPPQTVYATSWYRFD